jgi:hypothetical protein
VVRAALAACSTGGIGELSGHYDATGKLSDCRSVTVRRSGLTPPRVQRGILRADAQPPRERIPEVVGEALTASSHAWLNSIAKKARVGPDTV